MNSLSQLNKESLSNATRLLDELTSLGLNVLNKFPTASYDRQVFIFLNMMERSTFQLESINTLLKHFHPTYRSEPAIGLILRACLLDFMTITYLCTYMQNNSVEGKQELEREIESLLSDQVQNTLKYLKMARDTGLIKTPEYEQAVNATFENYGYLFSDTVPDYSNPGKKLKQQIFISPKQIFLRVHQDPLTKRFSGVYDLYNYYSKYEHFGVMTHLLQRIDVNEQMKTIFISLQYAFKAIGAALNFLNGEKNVLAAEIKEYDLISQKFDQIIIASASA